MAAGTAIATMAFLVLMLFPRPVFRLFNPDAFLIDEGAHILRTVIILLPCIGVQIVGATLFQALGKAGPALFLSMSRQVLFLIPLVLLLPRLFGLTGLWFAIPLADLLSVSVTVACVTWQMKNLHR